MRESLLERGLVRAFEWVNRRVEWHRLPVWLGIPNLLAFRLVLRRENLHDTWAPGALERAEPRTTDPELLQYRTPDGSYNDLDHPDMGKVGTRFGRNVPRERTWPEPEPRLIDPSPREISRRLMTRESFRPAESLNVLAAAWIQFQTHDWFSHGTNPRGNELLIPLAEGDDWPEDPMRIPRTPVDATRAPDEQGPPTFINECSHWWDASAIYGCDVATMAKLRTLEGGKLVLANGRLPVDPATGLVKTGFNDNWWVGLGLLHTLFTLEHNAICDRLATAYPTWSDERLFQTARLVNAALMAKIHTVEWTPAIIAHPTLKIGMRANWWGLATERVYRMYGRLSASETISGIPGSPTDHHGVPFALTEEFVAVYRLHPLIPDELTILSGSTGEVLRRLPFREAAHQRAQTLIAGDISVTDVLYSFGVTHPGAVTLHNYPRFLQDFTRPDGYHLDLAAVDVTRDRERGIPRYNEFRRLLHMKPAASFEELTADPRWAAELREVYRGDIERVDLMVGMYAETPPRGFGFSDTAFRVFILMASRRLKSDRFFTTDFRPEVYSPVGMKWIGDNDMGTVLLRHYPELAPALRGVKNAFAPWNRILTRAAAQAPAAERVHAAGS